MIQPGGPSQNKKNGKNKANVNGNAHANVVWYFFSKWFDPIWPFPVVADNCSSASPGRVSAWQGRSAGRPAWRGRTPALRTPGLRIPDIMYAKKPPWKKCNFQKRFVTIFNSELFLSTFLEKGV